MYKIAFTGHRPKDLPGIGYRDFRDALDALHVGERKDLHFIVGGALGTDTWAAWYAVNNDIPFTLVTPFDIEVMSGYWSEYDRQTLQTHANCADKHIIINITGYDVRAYQERNMAMVDMADYVFAVYTGKRGGGTYNCINYALKQDKSVYNLFPLNGKIREIKSI